MKRILLLALSICLIGCTPATPTPPHIPAPLKKLKKPPMQTVEVLDFWAPWCGPCLANQPAIKVLKAEGYKIEEINIDLHPAKKIRWQVNIVPTYIVLVNGREAHRVHSAGELRAILHGKFPLKK